MQIKTLKDGIFYFVYTFDTNYIKTVFNNIKPLKITEEYSIEMLKSVYMIYMNRKYFIDSCKEENRKIVMHTIALLMAKFENQYNSFKIIEDLIDIDKENLKGFFDYINRYSFKINNEYIIPTEKRTILWNLDKERSFIIETRSGRNYKNILTNNILEWINIRNDKDILIPGNQCESCNLLNNKGCLSKYIKGKCQGKTLNISPKLIGAKSEYDKLFNSIDITDKRKFNRLDSINLLDYFEDDGIKLFNKSYVEILYMWSNDHGADDRNKLYEDIKDNIDILNKYVKKEISNIKFKNLYEAFIKRKDNNEKSCNTLSYYLGVALLVMGLESFDKLKNKPIPIEKMAINKLYSCFRKNFHDLFIRDLVIVELYVTGLGE